jgi:DNA repair protein RadA/Sms
MARPAPRFVCSQCAHSVAKWAGQCPGCGEWNTLVEDAPQTAVRGRAGGGARAAAHVRLREVTAADVPRLMTGMPEVDRVLGGGLVPGSVVLLGGSPGIGKSTLTGMALGNVAAAGRRTLYVSGEESAAQIRLRAERLGAAALEVPVLAETDLDTVLATLEAERPEVCVIDSVQTLVAGELTGAAGSVGQVREVADRLTRLAKSRGIAVILVGHVTKEGALAGPRVLEHLVDAVLQFEGERERLYRTLRAPKNRYVSSHPIDLREKVVSPEIGDLSLFRATNSAADSTQCLDLIIFLAIEPAAQARRWRGSKLIPTEDHEGCDIPEPGNCHGGETGRSSG